MFQLESTPAAPHVALLRVFAYGTLPEYRQHASTLPPLSPAQLLKLRQLTVVQMADASVSMPYDELMAAKTKEVAALTKSIESKTKVAVFLGI